MSATKLVMPDEYKLSSSMKKMQLLERKAVEGGIPNFVGVSLIESMFYLYLFKKYGNNCFLIDNFSRYAPNEMLGEILGLALVIRPNYTEQMMKQNVNYMKNVAINLVKCIERDSDIIIIPITLIFKFNEQNEGGHANILVYRKKYNHIEHFEPHGSKYIGKHSDSFVKSINTLLRIFVECINQELDNRGAFADGEEKPIVLVESDKVCPYLAGFQYHEERSSFMKIVEKEGGGYCSVWSMFFTELCLRNPHMTSNEIISYVFNQKIKYYIGDYFRKIVRGYAFFINEKILNYYSFLNDEPLGVEIIKQIIKSGNTKKHDLLVSKMRIIIFLEMEMFFNPNVLEMRRVMCLDELAKGEKSKDYLNKIALELWVINKYKREMNNLKSPLTSHSFNIQNMKMQEQKEKECPSGKVANPNTNRCVKIKTPKEKTKMLVDELINKQKDCPPGKILNPNTNRCNKIKTPKEKTKTLDDEPINKKKECPPGKILNPNTNRCNKIKTIKPMKPMKTMKITIKKECPPGKILNPITNRCNSIRTRKQKPFKETKI